MLQTTAHSLCFTFALLALYPDEQERLYQQIKDIMADLNGMPVGSIRLGLKFTEELISHRPMKT
jgi:cytochrome P450